MNIYLLYPFKFCIKKFFYIAIPTKINITNIVERGFSYYIFIKKINFLIIKIEIICRYNIIINNNKNN